MGSEVEVITPVSSGIDRRYSYRLLPFMNKICVHVWGSSNCRVTRQHSEHNQWHVGSHFSRVEFQTFKLWSGQTKHVTMFTQDTRGPNKNPCFQNRLAELTHADIHTDARKHTHKQEHTHRHRPDVGSNSFVHGCFCDSVDAHAVTFDPQRFASASPSCGPCPP